MNSRKEAIAYAYDYRVFALDAAAIFDCCRPADQCITRYYCCTYARHSEELSDITNAELD
jgi:hypothetical protein